MIQRIIRIKKSVISFLTVTVCCTTVLTAHIPQWREGHIYRDPHIEKMLLDFLIPLYEAANLDGRLVQPRLIIDPQYNAFATLENLIVVNTGFFYKTKSPEEVAGVLAHETGHQMGRHVVRTLSNVVPQSIATMALGAVVGGAVAVITGQPEAGLMGIIGGQQLGMSHFTAYSRTQEASADDMGILLLKKLSWPINGLKQATDTMLEFSKEYDTKNLPLYIQTHPPSQDRKNHVTGAITPAEEQLRQLPKGLAHTYDLCVGRIKAFTSSPQDIIKEYQHQSAPQALYALAIAHARQGNFDASLPFMTTLITQAKNTPEFKKDVPYLIFARGELLYAKEI